MLFKFFFTPCSSKKTSFIFTFFNINDECSLQFRFGEFHFSTISCCFSKFHFRSSLNNSLCCSVVSELSLIKSEFRKLESLKFIPSKASVKSLIVDKRSYWG